MGIFGLKEENYLGAELCAFMMFIMLAVTEIEKFARNILRVKDSDTDDTDNMEYVLFDNHEEEATETTGKIIITRQSSLNLVAKKKHTLAMMPRTEWRVIQ